MYKLTVFIPDSALENVKSALFNAGAGHIGNYSGCCWQTLGESQFTPIEGSQPYIGQQGTSEKVAEWRVEMIVSKHKIRHVIDTLIQAHPYETPAYDVIETLDI